MPATRVFEDQEYYPEFGTLAIREGWESDQDGGPLAEDGTNAQPCGTFAVAGNGWLLAAAGDGAHQVRLEAHDEPPPIDGGWDDVMETPFRGSTGVVGLTYLTAGEQDDDLDLGAVGLFRLRVTRQRGRDGNDRWRLQFWPVAEPPDPPRWLARDRPPVGRPRSGWNDLLPFHAALVRDRLSTAAASHGGSATLDQMATAEGWPSVTVGWLDEPLLPTTAVRQSAGRTQRVLDGLAAQLGVTTPTTPRTMIALLVAAGVVAEDVTGEPPRYRIANPPPLPEQVLALPPETTRKLAEHNDFLQYAPLAADLVSVAAWSPAHTIAATPRQLAERVLAHPDDVSAALRYAVDHQQLRCDGEPGDADALLTLSVPPAAPPSPSLSSSGHARVSEPGPPGSAPARTGAALVAPSLTVSFTGTRADPVTTTPPMGPPPRTGIVTGDGRVMTWRGGRFTTVARLPTGHVHTAVDTRHGIVVSTQDSPVVLVRPDGDIAPVSTIAARHVLTNEYGTHLVLVTASTGGTGTRIELVDLATGDRQAMPWNPATTAWPIAMHGGVVQVAEPGTTPTSYRWVPGRDPERLDHRVAAVDPVSGRIVAWDASPGVLMIEPDGTRRRMALNRDVRLVPGGYQLYGLSGDKPAITLYDPAAGPDDRTIWWLPRHSETDAMSPHRPVWEAEHLLVVQLRVPDATLGVPAVRLDVRTGRFQRVPFTDDWQRGALVVEPLGNRGPLPS